MASSAETGITIRQVPLEFPADLDPIVVPGCPEESFVDIGLSLLLPYLEPYLIRSMRTAKSHVANPRLLADLEAFNGQEGQHYRQHMRFNEAIRLAGFPGLAALEAGLEADYRRFSETKSLRFNLAYAEGFEAFTTALACYSFETHMIDRLSQPARGLFEWHLVEELEHRTVAFDVYQYVCGGYFYRLFVGLFAQWHLHRFVLRAAAVLRGADREAFRRKYGGPAQAWARMWPLFFQAFRLLLPKVLATYLPWYTPHRIEMPPRVRELAERYTELAAGASTPAIRDSE
jgi:predicted metal-dependent hydrolase